MSDQIGPSVQDQAIFDAYVAGATCAQVAETFQLSGTAVFHALRRVGGRGGGYSLVSRANREAANRQIVTHAADAAREIFALKPGALWSGSRKKQISRARQAVFLVSREHGVPLAAIGREFEMDHTTVLHGCRAAQNLAEREACFSVDIAALRAAIPGRQPRVDAA